MLKVIKINYIPYKAREGIFRRPVSPPVLEALKLASPGAYAAQPPALSIAYLIYILDAAGEVRALL